MAKREYAFYPGCSSTLRGSAANYLVSVNSMCDKLDIKMTQIPDWNCCGASISYAGSSELARHVLSARNFALSDKYLPGQDIVATCAACWLGGRESIEKLDASSQLLADTNEALKEAGLEYKAGIEIRHMVEVLVEDLGYEELGKPVVKPLDGVKVAGYVGCQTNRPFGIAGESFENPLYLDKLIETVGGEALSKYEEKVSCCGGSLAFCEPEKAEKQIKNIVEAAYDQGADVICTITAARTPVLEGAWLSPGAHVNAVGASLPSARELDTAAVVRSRLFVDRRESTLSEAGDFLVPRSEGAITDAHILGELGDLLAGSVKGRVNRDDVTLFKSLGLAVEDVAALRHIHGKAVATGTGTSVALGGLR